MKKIIASLIALLAIPTAFGGNDLVWFDGKTPVTYGFSTTVDPVVATAAYMFSSDMEAVTGSPANNSPDAVIIISQIDRSSTSRRDSLASLGVPVSQLDSLTDGFDIRVNDDNIMVTGNNGRGTAYGLLELSRIAGVTPWVWWGDVTPERRDILTIDRDFTSTQGASVEFRGIFINDEDWSSRPWCDGTIGPDAYRQIFRLLMRLRANACWPAMHPGSEAFFKNPRNKAIADSCGIAIGSSHCEPLLRNNVDEWDTAARGRFNYISNRQAVKDYWTERLREVRNSAGGNILTIGMRGIHDSSMEGVNTMDEKLEALQQVIDDQQQLIADNLGKPEEQMQVFVPYKEVLQLYEMGLDVKDYVTLMWCDDNYGYLTRLSTADEQKRQGGAGIYYHLSYWGRPHDYLWLTTTQPGLIFNELHEAYNHGMRKLWIANVHDPKVAAYDLELFLDLAWDINGVKRDSVGLHLQNWLCRNFGAKAGSALYPAMRKYYNLTAKRRPEFMGWSQVELDKKIYHRGLSPVTDTDFSFSEFGDEASAYLASYHDIVDVIDSVGSIIRPSLRDAYFAAIKYPVTAAAANAEKHLMAQLARQATDSVTMRASAAKSVRAYQAIQSLTDYYNTSMAGGKWNRSMSMHPRDLPVFEPPRLPDTVTSDERQAISISPDVIARNASQFQSHTGKAISTDMLGHSGHAVWLDKGSSLTFEFTVNDSISTPLLYAAMIPTHPAFGDELRFSVTIDGGKPDILSLKEPFRSERWKLNVLRGQALSTIQLDALAPGSHTITFTALDHRVILDQWMIDPMTDRRFYLIPSK